MTTGVDVVVGVALCVATQIEQDAAAVWVEW